MIHGWVPMTGLPQHIIDFFGIHSMIASREKKGNKHPNPSPKQIFGVSRFPKIVVESGGNIANCRTVFPEKNDL